MIRNKSRANDSVTLSSLLVRVGWIARRYASSLRPSRRQSTVMSWVVRILRVKRYICTVQTGGEGLLLRL